MTLNEFLAHHKRNAYDDVVSGVPPHGARCDEARLKDLSMKGRVTMGTTILKPNLIVFEFIFTLDGGQTEVFSTELDPPERIVCLPVPSWVVEDVWQGEVQGSYHFESDAKVLMDKYLEEIKPANNAKWFERPKPKRRE